MISQYLAWNWNKVSVNSELYATFLDYFNEIYKKSWGTNAWLDAIENFIDQYATDGFSTATAIEFVTDSYVGPEVYAAGATTPWTHALPATGIQVAAVNRQGRIKENNFHGIILGGKAAVSKDKAKQLDQTVEDSILKYYDIDAYDNYHLYFNGTTNTWAIVNGQRYTANMWNTGVVTGVYPTAGYLNDNMLVMPRYGNFNTWYVPVTSATGVEATYSADGLTLLGYTYKIEFAGFDNTTLSQVNDVALYVTVDGNYNLIRADFLPADANYKYNAVGNFYYV
jgi:hypothetical protein